MTKPKLKKSSQPVRTSKRATKGQNSKYRTRIVDSFEDSEESQNDSQNDSPVDSDTPQLNPAPSEQQTQQPISTNLQPQVNQQQFKEMFTSFFNEAMKERMSSASTSQITAQVTSNSNITNENTAPTTHTSSTINQTLNKDSSLTPPNSNISSNLPKVVKPSLKPKKSKSKVTPVRDSESTESDSDSSVRRKSRKRKKRNTPSESDTDSDYPTEPPPPAVQKYGLLVGQTLKQKLKKKIVTGKYVEMFDLLPSSKFKTGRLVINKNLELWKPYQKKILSIKDWNQAFSIFMTAYVKRATSLSECQTLIQELLTYKQVINNLSDDGKDWDTYDRMFRSDKEEEDYAFSVIRHDLILCGDIKNSDPQSFRRDKQPFRQRSNFKKDFIPQGYCWKFNTMSAYCEQENGCNFKHECPLCQGRHPGYNCNKNKPNTQQPIKNPSTTNPQTRQPPPQAVSTNSNTTRKVVPSSG